MDIPSVKLVSNFILYILIYNIYGHNHAILIASSGFRGSTERVACCQAHPHPHHIDPLKRDLEYRAEALVQMCSYIKLADQVCGCVRPVTRP